MFVAHLVSLLERILVSTTQVRRVFQEAEMRKPELKRLTAALRQLTPVQRKIVSAELASLDAQPASTVIIESRFASAASCPHCESSLDVA
jgi:hypothetical protein